VYVDEDNALSTRPRLQLKYDLMDLAGLDDSYDLIDVYNLHDGYLLHVKKDNKGYMYRFEEKDGVLKNPVTITGDKPVEKCKIFEQNDNIYVLTGDGYKNIIENEISDVVGYIPTTTIGKNKRIVEKDETTGEETVKIVTEGSAYESVNIISDKTKETYFWDGISQMSIPSNTVNIENNYYISSDILKNFDVVKYYPDNTFLFKKTQNAQTSLFIGKISSTFKTITEYDLKISYPDYVSINNVNYYSTLSIPSTTNDKILILYEPYGKTDETGARIASGRTTIYNITEGYKATSMGYMPDLAETGYRIDASGKTYDCSENAKYVWSGVTSFWEKDTSVVQGGYKHRTLQLPADGRTAYKLMISESGNIAYAIKKASSSDGGGRPVLYCRDNFSEYVYGDEFSTIFWDDLFLIDETKIQFLPNGDGVLYFDKGYSDDVVVIRLKENDFKVSEFQYSETATSAKFIFDYSGSKNLYYYTSDNALYYVPDYTDLKQYYRLPFGNLSGITDIYLKNVIVIATNDSYNLLYYKESNEPELIITLKKDRLSENEELLYDVFASVKLFERFDNNTWFASKNYTFHTAYNDPTYIPLSSYNDLGEDFEEITGLSIVNDNVLSAYKRNRIYIITPVTVGNEETYSYTETKNVVGNDVPDAPILTILTEMPTIVSYDGIFALNQLENVQSSDRITTLISENINPRWLKESSEDIDNCKTLNRLYWTYYILPHKRIGDENKDYTKIYLLDNRTQQWYYWELPIYVINAMVKDNKTHFVNENGTVFTLEITDLIHEFNPDVTEYYDKVNDEKLIIPWHWTSQILSLSTINYSKKLVDTTFILTDTDTQDEYGLDYSFKAWRKSVSETNATTISNNIHYVQSTTKRTMIPRFNFIQIKLSNTAEDLDNNKLRLVGLGLKYVLLEGLY
jgi:hypothetical protein